MGLVRHLAAWFDTGEAVDWLKMTNADGMFLLRRVKGQGVHFTASRDTTQVDIGVRSEDLVQLGRYLLAVALDEGQNINQGFNPGGN